MRSLTFVSSHRSKIFNNPASPWLVTRAKDPVETEEMVAENKESQKFLQIKQTPWRAMRHNFYARYTCSQRAPSKLQIPPTIHI